MLTVILLCWKRFVNFEEILAFWLRQKEVGQVVVFDNSGTFKTDLPILLIKSNENLGPGARLPVVQFAKHDHILFCDDDVELRDGIVEDLLRHFKPDSNIVGVMGKLFDGPDYYRCTWVQGCKVGEPTEADYIPYNLLLTHRKFCLAVDSKDCPDFMLLDDIWWMLELRKRFKELKFLVVPTKNYKFRKENEDKVAMHLNTTLQKRRRKYYREVIKGGGETE